MKNNNNPIGIVGAGRMGSGIAQVAAESGSSVILVDIRQKSLEGAFDGIAKNIDQKIQEGALQAGEKNRILSNIKTTTDFALLRETTLCIEAVVENVGIKTYLHKKIREKAGPNTIIASNTATLSVARLAKQLGDAERFIGIAFGFPPQTTKDVKIIRAPKSSQATIDAATRIFSEIGRTVREEQDHKAPFYLSLKATRRMATWALALSFFGIFLSLSEYMPAEESKILGWISLGFGVTALTSLFIMLRSAFSRLRAIVNAMTGLAADDTSVIVPDTDNADEYGDIARIIDIFKNVNMQLDKKLAQEQAERDRRAKEEKERQKAKLAGEFESSVASIVDGVAQSAQQLQSNAQHLFDVADQTSRQSANVASATEEASASVQTVASAAEELSTSISEINRQVAESARIATVAVEEVHKTDATVSTLSEAATQIGDVAKLIQSIAEQTNLLALNATIEAARAGDAGKGFAVVAGEVKNLANQTAHATEEITKKIMTVQTVSLETVEAIRSIEKTIQKISEISGIIADAIQQQTNATKEISLNVQQASVGTSEVSSSIGNVTQAADESHRSAEEVQSASTILSQQAAKLREEIHNFLDKMKSC